jgi:hypothetical protein
MRRRSLVPLLLLLSACGADAVRRSFKPSLEGQSPPEPVQAVKPFEKEPPAPNSAAADAPSWLRSQAPVEWTMPPGWEAELSTKPQRLIEVTLEKNGPGGMPIQFLILNGADDHPQAKQASLDRWETFYHQDVPRTASTTEHDGLRITRFRVHGEYDGPTFASTGGMLKEPNWTMDCGWVEGPSGSIMFRLQGPDAIVKPALEKVDALLASMRPRQKQ